ncbi:factor associated with metabolism and energy [Paroedura picta]|uniref:factor associated with metabolism and energy n=1 Tax=Paroedura picta TaxID=143630 RepID=UPI0040564C8E
MGLGSSKNRSHVTRVAPMPAKEAVSPSLGSVDVYGFQNPLREMSSISCSSLMGRNFPSERCLPPLRETWQARYATAPGPYPPDLKMEDGEPSIIKQHPPRRPQKLEPLILSKDVPLDKYSRQRTGTAAWAVQGLEKGGPAVVATPGRRRQHLHKMRVLERHQEAEQKRRLRQEATTAKPKRKDFRVQQKFGQQGLQEDSSDDEELFAVQHDDLGVDPWASQIHQGHRLPETHPGHISKVESWLRNQQVRRESFWDAWSIDSDSWKGSDEGKLSRRPALVRTKTERIQLFDEFFDREF